MIPAGVGFFRESTMMRLACVAAAALSVVGCSTVVNGSYEEIKFTSEPSGADVIIGDAPKGQTPAVIQVHRSDDPVKVEIRKEGFESQTVELTTQLEEVSLVNIIFPIGFAVDYVSDAMHQFTVKEVHATLKKK
jgi:hypothetical protein